MGADNKVNLKQMLETADKIADRGNTMSNRISNVYDDIEKMQTYWRGENYANFVKITNTLTDDFTRISKYFVQTLPNEIVKKRNQYAKSSGKKATDAIANYGSTIYDKLKVADQGDEIIFKDAKMNDLYDKIETRFENVRSDLDKIDDLFDKITWEGEAGRIVKREFKARVTETKAAMKDIKTALKENIRAARNAMNKAEEGNATSSQKVDTSNLGTQASSLDANTSELDSQSYNWNDET